MSITAASSTPPVRPDAAALGNWILSWVQPGGAIHGFHNHPVWGGNPYRWADFTAGHTTWASPFIAGLAEAHARRPDARARALLERLIDYQTASFLPDGQYDHIGFNAGEICKKGLIHNAIPNLSLSLAALHGRDWLGAPRLDRIRAAILRVADACREYGDGGRPSLHRTTCNQDYAHIWAKLVFGEAFGDRRWHDEIPADLDFLIRHYHVRGFPDDECSAALRETVSPDIVEPSEYYGLMIAPLLLAGRIYGNERYVDEARRLCRHVARSQWRDERGQTRCHRFWFRANGQWQLNRTPMLIGGMGDTLQGIQHCVKLGRDTELEAFLAAGDRTYAHYQHPRGFFAAATGWQSECDIVPSTGWQSHDFRHLVHRHGAGADFWDRLFAPDDGRTSVLLGDQCLWVERGPHWAVYDYLWQDVFRLLGRKDRVRFGREKPDWVEGGERLPADYAFPAMPAFIKTDTVIAPWQGASRPLNAADAAGAPASPVTVTSIAKLPFVAALGSV